jgi:hypothetical protein
MSKLGSYIIDELETQDLTMEELQEKGLFNENSKH